ncbi:hypothetical protein HYH03_011679 [Edaphochlamys debaryana]|uniref:Methyltransferase type 11 domain-containing protein n=1 Tax=Edaphochlamys debaryana TaxID=47281 RepID=A0A835XUF5_9CHLO|nr:hypothetical protein HYH03_011679 [Edaphochlamys debaryana]|eukprot:KAG2489877.1 hypothetical protein HYH03_011679 [Edaphochlamys debaryana]
MASTILAVASSTSTSAAAAPAPDPARLFVDPAQAAAYAQHRPTYPQALYDAIYARALPGRPGPPFPDLTAVDIATGSGQALGPLPRDFGTCIALDTSEAQLQRLPPHVAARVRAQVGDAHATGLPAGSADLVVVGQAMHWFRLPEFYREVRRILKPGGALASWCYGFGTLSGFPGAQEFFEDFHSGPDWLGPHWAPGRLLVDNAYRGIEPGPEHFASLERVELAMPATLTLDDMVGLIQSWSARVSYLKARPQDPDPAEAFRAEAVRRIRTQRDGSEGGAKGAGAGGDEGSSPLHLDRTLTLLLARGPQPL